MRNRDEVPAVGDIFTFTQSLDTQTYEFLYIAVAISKVNDTVRLTYLCSRNCKLFQTCLSTRLSSDLQFPVKIFLRYNSAKQEA